MRVAIISPWAVSNTAVGGTERFVLDLARAFRDLGNEVDVYMLSGKSHKDEGINFINLRILGTDDCIDEFALAKLFGDFSDEQTYIKIADMLESLIDGSKYDLIQLNSQLFLKAWNGRNRIFTIHTNPFEYELSFGLKSFNCMLETMKKESKNNSAYFVAPSEYYAKVYNDLTNITIYTIPHAIDLSRLECEKTKTDICNSLLIDNNIKKILLPSRLEPIQKQPMLFMRAFSCLDEKLKRNYQVICTGLDKQYMQYVDEIEEFCHNEKINLKIMRFASMAEAYKIADLVVLPSQSESFGYAALESLSLGIPTILNSIPTYLEIVNGSINSFVFDKTEDSLFEKLGILLKTDLKEIKQSELWQNRYSLNTFGKKYLNLIETYKGE